MPSFFVLSILFIKFTKLTFTKKNSYDKISKVEYKYILLLMYTKHKVVIKMRKFTKMEGLGNDYIYMDCTKSGEPENIASLAQIVSDRHFGIGGDGLILICKSDIADFKMRMFNADGSEARDVWKWN